MEAHEKEEELQQNSSNVAVYFQEGCKTLKERTSYNDAEIFLGLLRLLVVIHVRQSINLNDDPDECADSFMEHIGHEHMRQYITDEYHRIIKDEVRVH